MSCHDRTTVTEFQAMNVRTVPSLKYLVLLVVGLVGACGKEPPTENPAECPIGAEGCPCTLGGGCDKDLDCRSQRCVILGNNNGSGGKASDDNSGGASVVSGGSTGTESHTGGVLASGGSNEGGAESEGEDEPIIPNSVDIVDAWGGKCHRLPVIFRDFKGYQEGGHTDFEISAHGARDVTGQIYAGLTDAGCGMVLDTLTASRKPQLFTGIPDQASGLKVKFGVGKQQRRVTGPGCWTPERYEPKLGCEVKECVQWTFEIPISEITSTASFADWYRTKDDVNMAYLAEIVVDPNTQVFEQDLFTPLDGKGFGDTEGEAHNYHFTTESHVEFIHEAGQVLMFRGTDDLWIYVNGVLVVDLGGYHQPLQASIDFDSLGLVRGNTYKLDLFHANRTVRQSEFYLKTNIKCFKPVDP